MSTLTAIFLIVIYLRVSTEEQAKRGYSLPEQREACHKKAQEIAQAEQAAGRQVQIVEFIDTFGGDIAERPVLEEVTDFVKDRRPAWFVCMDPDRFSRNATLQQVVADEIEKAGTRLAFVQHNYEQTDEGKLFFQIRGSISQFEKAKIRERTTRGKRGKVKAGKRPNGACPFGYRHNKATDHLEIHEPEAQWVRAMFRWILEDNLSVYQVALRLNEMGIRTKFGRQWRRSTVADMLRNTSYIGQMVCNRWDMRGLGPVRRLPKGKRQNLTAKIRSTDEWKTVPVPPIIDEQLFRSVQDKLQAITRKGGQRHTGLLSMLLRCGVCNGHMGYSRHTSGKYYLKCNRRYADLNFYKDPTRCTNRHHQALKVEAEVWDKLTAWLTDPELMEAYLQAQQTGTDLDEQVRLLVTERDLVATELADKRREQAAIISQQAKQNIREQDADVMLAELRPHLDSLEQRLGQLNNRVHSLRDQADQVKEATDRVRKLAETIAAKQVDISQKLAALDPARRRSLVLKIVQEIIIRSDGSWVIIPCRM